MKRVFPGATSGAAALGLISATLLAGGCQNSLYEESRALHEQNRGLQTALSNTHDELEARPTEAQVVSLQQQIAERDQMLADLQAKLNAPDVDTGVGIPDIDENVNVSMEGNTLTMEVAGDVLFPSGSATVNKNAEATLSRIAEILKSEYAGKPIRVEGHTDTDPISKTKKLFADNRDLSLRRAYAVTTFLEGKGVEPQRLETVGHGEHKPLGATKKDNRRVSIKVVI